MTLLTEDEALLRWCPLARGMDWINCGPEVGERPVAANRGQTGDPRPECHCIASACMAWRVAQKEIRREKTDAATERSFRQAHGLQVRVEPHNWPSSGYDTLVVDARGYCGAFGTVTQ